MHFEIKKIYGFAEWEWRMKDQDFCIVCQSHFQFCCPSCTIPGEDCQPILGVCGHGYHLHCIQKWLVEKNKEECPTCKQLWQFSVDSDDSLKTITET